MPKIMDIEIIKYRLENALEFNIHKKECRNERFDLKFIPHGFKHCTFKNRMNTLENGVYLIGDFYIGYSQNIKTRLKAHWDSFKSGRSSELMTKAFNRYSGKKIPVFLLSPEKESEAKCIEIANNIGFQIINKKEYAFGSEEYRINKMITELKFLGYKVTK